MVECVLTAGAALGECPVWSAAEQRLYWIDIDGKAVHRFDPATGADEVRFTPGRPGSLALSSQPGRLLLASEHQIGWFHWDGAAFEPWLDLEEAGTGNRLNDGRCDRSGRFWVGSMYEDTSAGRSSGMLHRVGPDGVTAVRRRDIGVSNGSAFSPDGTVMYFADTFEATVWAYDYDAASGEPSNERVFLEFTDLPGKPDGACVDEAGCYWIACVYGWAVARITPAGAVDRVVEVPVQKPTMPAFGGPDLETMFVTSISTGTTGQECAGGIVAVDAGVRGLPEPRFDG